jgi:hypothetical protein
MPIIGQSRKLQLREDIKIWLYSPRREGQHKRKQIERYTENRENKPGRRQTVKAATHPERTTDPMLPIPRLTR